MKSWTETDKVHAQGLKVINSMWTFVYKMDKHGYLQRCKARLVVCGNQQEKGDLPMRVTTLASTAFQTLMGITAKFNLETVQIDAVNAFVHCDLDEVMNMQMPPGFTKPGKVLRLRKTLYGFWRSPILWQRSLTASFRELGFREVPQEPCAMLMGGIIVFFYVDDIIFCYQKRDKGETHWIIRLMQERYQLNILSKLK
jgi:hypothetical protein